MKSALLICLLAVCAAAVFAANPHQVFLDCCEIHDKIPRSCYDICHFDRIGPGLKAILRKKSSCPKSSVGGLMYCMGSGENHSSCCRNAGVASTKVGDECLQFCDMRPGATIDARARHMPCLKKAEDILGCFEDYAATLD